MRKWVRVGLVGCTMAGVLASGAALADDYPDGLEASAPAAMRAFQAIVPARYRKAAWVYRFNGTASPMQTVQFGGLPFWLGEVCKPHDCGGNEVTFLIAKDGVGGLWPAALRPTDALADHPVRQPEPGCPQAARRTVSGAVIAAGACRRSRDADDAGTSQRYASLAT